MHFTATHLQCVYHFPEEAFTDRQDHVLIGERAPRPQAVTARYTAIRWPYGNACWRRFLKWLNTTS